MSAPTPGAPPGGPNRLADEKSPYLLQHAHNPVDWYPWGDEAFARAAQEDRPIFLSIGYATCHWCHVMEHESFEDDGVARLLNEGFISIKVDREERPDIDAVYMTVCQLMNHQGGWPLTIVMTPDKRPFFAGTYFPRESVPGRIGMLELLPRLTELWHDRRPDVEASGEAALSAVAEMETRVLAGAGDTLGPDTLKRGFDELFTRFDEHQGGFGTAPKFPTPHQLLFLLRWADRSGDPRPIQMVERTLDAMRRGGIFDHVGFGFHRYSTDARWLVPHFEKMLYDQAQLAMAYTELWQVTGEACHRSVAEEIFEYVLRDLTDPAGGFYSAEDADSEGREGAFYVWTREELDAVLSEAIGEEAAALARSVFGVESRGNFADEASGVRTGENILHHPVTLEEAAEAHGVMRSELEGRLEEVRAALFEHRATRPRPLLDDKVLTDWNGLMIAAFAIGGRVFGEARLTNAAERAATFVLDRLRDEDGRLLHRYRDGDAAIRAGATDYAYLAWGLLELYGATFDPVWLQTAGELVDLLVDGFWDDENLGVFNADAERTDVPVRQKEVYDGATPSANAVTWYVLLRLGRLTGDVGALERAAALGRMLAGSVTRTPSGHTMSLMALDLSLGPSSEVVLVGDPAAEDTRAMLDALGETYRPRTAVIVKPSGDGAASKRLARIAPFTAGHEPLNGQAAAYVCSEFVCQRPTNDASEMLGLLG